MTVLHIVVAMKPVEGNYAENALANKVAGLNIDGIRVGVGTRVNIPAGPRGKGAFGDGGSWERCTESTVVQGRWPANVIHDGSDEVVTIMDKQSGITKSSGGKTKSIGGDRTYGKFAGDRLGQNSGELGDTGGASRFFKECKKENK